MVLSIRSLSHYPIDDVCSGLTDDQRALRETVFNFCQKELAPLAQERSYLLKMTPTSSSLPNYHINLGCNMHAYLYSKPCENVKQRTNFGTLQQDIDKKNNFDDMRPFWRKLGDLGLLGITASSKVQIEYTQYRL